MPLSGLPFQHGVATVHSGRQHAVCCSGWSGAMHQQPSTPGLPILHALHEPMPCCGMCCRAQSQHASSAGGENLVNLAEDQILTNGFEAETEGYHRQNRQSTSTKPVQNPKDPKGPSLLMSSIPDQIGGPRTDIFYICLTQPCECKVVCPSIIACDRRSCCNQGRSVF